MFEHSEAGVIMVAMLDTRRSNKEGLYPVKIRVTHRRERKYYGTGKYLSEADWEKLPSIKRRSGDNKPLFELKDDVQVMADKVKENIKDLIRNDLFSFDALNARLGNTSGNSLTSLLVAKINEYQKLGRISTSGIYKDTVRTLILFMHPTTDKATLKGNKVLEAASMPVNKITVSQITPAWLKRYELQMLEDGKSYTTISMYMRCLKSIVNEAVATGIIKKAHFPFGKGKYEIPQHEGRNMALSLADIGKIVKHECESATTAMSRDLWFFSYLCNGANITDICKFKYSSIRNGEICFYRQKTLTKAKKKKLIHAIVTPEMTAIMERWGNPAVGPDTFVFPFLKGGESPENERRIIKNVTKTINKKMQALGEKLGIGSISTYTARHSFASVLKRSGANIAFISESLGHADLKVTEHYLASFEQDERAKNAALLTNF